MGDLSRKLLERIAKHRGHDGLFSKYFIKHAGQADIDYIEGFNKILRTHSYYSIDGKRVF